MKWISFEIEHNDENKRIDSVCKKILEMPFTVLMKEVRKKNIRLNNAKVDIQHKVKKGDVLNVAVFLEKHITKKAQKFLRPATKTKIILEIPVLYENKGIVILDKPMGKKIFPIYKNKNKKGIQNTIIEQLRGAYAQHISLTFTPAPCHRLDTGTSGILINAYTAQAARDIQALQMQEKIIKIYVGIVSQRISKPYITHELYRDTITNVTYTFVNQEDFIQQAKTQTYLKKYKYLGKAQLQVQCVGEFSHNETHLFLYTLLLTGTGGKTHQIRAQCAAEQAHLFGDIKYASKKWQKNEMMNKSFYLHFSTMILDDVKQTILPKTLYAPVPETWKKTFCSQQARQCFDAWDVMIQNFCKDEKQIDLEKTKKFLKKMQG